MMATLVASAGLKEPVVEVVEVVETLTTGETSEGTRNDNDNAEDSEDQAWETESFYEDAYDQAEEEEEYGWDGADLCTLEESRAYKALLRNVGTHEFIRQTIEAGTVTAKKLCSAFGLPNHPYLKGAADEEYYPFLGVGIQRELRKRRKLREYNTIDDAVTLLQNSKNIVVLTGAGISTSLGIPDFRSKDTGLYSQLEYLGLSDPQEVFDIHLFREDPKIFYSVAKDILPSTNKFSPTHAFIKLLQDKGKLLTNFTQNIDNLEGHVGISADKLIQCHGSFGTATCQQCGFKVKGNTIHDEIKAGKVPRCMACTRRVQQIKPLGLKRKRSANYVHKSKKRHEYEDSTSEEEDQEAEIAGVMKVRKQMLTLGWDGANPPKPDITFFGEDLPDLFHDRLRNHDHDLADLVIVIGSSLKVAPVCEVPNFLPNHVPQLYISRDVSMFLFFSFWY